GRGAELEADGGAGGRQEPHPPGARGRDPRTGPSLGQHLVTTKCRHASRCFAGSSPSDLKIPFRNTHWRSNTRTLAISLRRGRLSARCSIAMVTTSPLTCTRETLWWPSAAR